MFFGQKCAQKSKIKRSGVSQVRTSFSEAPPYGLTCSEGILVVAIGNLALFQLKCRFFGFRSHFFDFGPVFGCHAPQIGKEPTGYLDAKYYAKHFEKKVFQKSL